MRKNSVAKIVAFLALFGIIIGIVGTGILIIFSQNTNNISTTSTNKTITNEDLQKIINNSKSSENGEKKEITLTGSKK